MERLQIALDPAANRELKKAAEVVDRIEDEDFEVLPRKGRKGSLMASRKRGKVTRKRASKVRKGRKGRKVSPVEKAIKAASAARVRRIQAQFAERARALQAEAVLTVARCRRTAAVALKVARAKRA